VLCVANLGEDTVTVTAELGAALAGAALTGLLGDPASAMLGDPAVDASGRVRLRLRPRGYLWLHVEPTHG